MKDNVALKVVKERRVNIGENIKDVLSHIDRSIEFLTVATLFTSNTQETDAIRFITSLNTLRAEIEKTFSYDINTYERKDD